MCAKLISKLTSEEDRKAMEVYQRAIVIEGLSYSPILPHPEYIEEVRKAGVTATHIGVTATNATLREALTTISGWYETVEKAGCRFAYSAADIVRGKKEGRVCVIMGSQNAKVFEDDICLVRIFHRLGLRIIQLAYGEQNYIGSGGEDVDAGLSLFGRKVVDEMNKVGILVDVSHCGDKTVMDAIKDSKSLLSLHIPTQENWSTIIGVKLTIRY